MTPPITPGQVTASSTASYAVSIIKMLEPIKNDSVTISAAYCGMLELRDQILILESNEITANG